MGQIPERLEELDIAPEADFAVMCHGGVRSLKVTRWLHQQGYTGARSVAGGIDLWAVTADPSVPRY